MSVEQDYLCKSYMKDFFLQNWFFFHWSVKLLKSGAPCTAITQTSLYLSWAESCHVHGEVFKVHWDHPPPTGSMCHCLQHSPVLPQWTSTAAQRDNWFGLVFPRHSGSWDTGKRLIFLVSFVQFCFKFGAKKISILKKVIKMCFA